MMNGMGGGIGMGFGWIFWLVIIGVAIWAVTQLTDNTRTSTQTSGNSARKDTPLDILKKRYARGEITESEYKEMRRNL